MTGWLNKSTSISTSTNCQKNYKFSNQLDSKIIYLLQILSFGNHPSCWPTCPLQSKWTWHQMGKKNLLVQSKWTWHQMGKKIFLSNWTTLLKLEIRILFLQKMKSKIHYTMGETTTLKWCISCTNGNSHGAILHLNNDKYISSCTCE